MKDIEELLFVNQVTQGVRQEREAIEWFSSASFETKQRILHHLAMMFREAHATEADIAGAVALARLKATYTPCVLMGRGKLAAQAARVIQLPESESIKAFRLFLHLFGIADSRRRSLECRSGCTHWWHQDLGGEVVVQELLTGRSPSMLQREVNIEPRLVSSQGSSDFHGAH